jgi:hypothetical protein
MARPANLEQLNLRQFAVRTPMVELKRQRHLAPTA